MSVIITVACCKPLTIAIGMAFIFSWAIQQRCLHREVFTDFRQMTRWILHTHKKMLSCSIKTFQIDCFSFLEQTFQIDCFSFIEHILWSFDLVDDTKLIVVPFRSMLYFCLASPLSQAPSRRRLATWKYLKNSSSGTTIWQARISSLYRTETISYSPHRPAS